MSSSSSSFSPSRSEELAPDALSFLQSFSTSLDEEAQTKCNSIWYEREMKGKALESIMVLHPSRIPSHAPEETPAPLNRLHNWRILGEWVVEKRADVNIFLLREVDGIDVDGPIVPGAAFLDECQIDGTLVRRQNIRLDNENNVYFGVPVSFNPALPYCRDAEQINLQTIGASRLCDLHEHEGVIVGDKMNPTLEKDAYIIHMGPVPHSVQHEENDYFTSFLIRNMQTQVESYFVLQRDKDEVVARSPMLLRGEFYFVIHYLSHFYEDGISRSRIVHGRSKKTVAKFPRTISSIVTTTNCIVVASIRFGEQEYVFSSKHFP